MNTDEIPKQLKELITQYGLPSQETTPQFKSLLQDVFVDHPREMNLLIAGLEEGLPGHLNAKKGIVPYDIISGQIIDRLHNTRGMDRNAADWMVRTWAEAIEYEIPSQKPKNFNENKKEEVITPPIQRQRTSEKIAYSLETRKEPSREQQSPIQSKGNNSNIPMIILAVVGLCIITAFILFSNGGGFSSDGSPKGSTDSSNSVSPHSSDSYTTKPTSQESTGGVQNGDMVTVEYTGTLPNGSVFDSSKKNAPFKFVIGTGNAITGFENEILGMKVGESKRFSLTPEQAYGEYDPTLIKVMPIGFIPNGEDVTIGDTVTLFNGEAYFPAKILAMNTTNVVFDLNNKLAGKTLTFDVKLLEITPANKV